MHRTPHKKTKLPLATNAAPEEAFAALRTEIETISIDELLTINLDVPYAVRCGLVAARNLEPLVPTMRKLPSFDPRPVEALRSYALALLYAHDRAIEPGLDVDSLPALVAEATPLRTVMLRLADLLAHLGFITAERVEAIRSGHGYANLADGLLALGRMFDELWHRIHDNVLVTRSMIDRAVTLAVALQDALAERERAKPNPLMTPTHRRYVRAQAFTAFVRVYAQAQRAVAFLRFDEGDATDIVPSLYSSRRRHHESSGAEAEASPEPKTAAPLAGDTEAPVEMRAA